MRLLPALGVVAVFAVGGLLAAACSPSDPVVGTGGATTGGAGGTGGAGTGAAAGICLLHNCNSDVECATCDSGRTHCLLDEHRCVACSGAGSSGCPSGYTCSSFGQCVPDGSVCPTDASGTPTISCASSADCVACDPAHQVCDAATQKCVS